MTYLRKLHPGNTIAVRRVLHNVRVRTVEESGYPVKYGSPKVDPTNEVKINGRILPTLENVVYGFVEYGYGSSRNGSDGYWRIRSGLPVTPAIVRGWAPNTEKTIAATEEDKSTSETPYSAVVSIRSSEKAIPGRTLDGDEWPAE